MTPGTNAVLRIVKLKKYYKTIKAVDGISFEVYESEIFGLLGPNGAGKTTTLEMIEGLRKPDSGEAYFKDINIVKNPASAKELIGVQLQATQLFETLTVMEILKLFQSFYTKKQDLEKILKDVSLVEKRDARVRELSGGQQHRLSLALALINDPEIIFLDEPTTGLDPQARHTMWDVISELRSLGKTIVITTHYMEEAEVLCDRLAIMDHGKIIEMDTPQALIKRHQPHSRIEFTTTIPVKPDIMRAIEGVHQFTQGNGSIVLTTKNPQVTVSELLRIAEDSDLGLDDLHIRRPTLEDVFLHLTGRSLRE